MKVNKIICIAVIIALAIALFISCLYNSKLENDLKKYENGFDVVGTYVYGEQISGDAEYFAFMPESKGEREYYRYKQFELIEKGTYLQDENLVNLYILNNADKNKIFVDEENLYDLNGKDSKIHKFKKIDEEAILINIEEN